MTRTRLLIVLCGIALGCSPSQPPAPTPSPLAVATTVPLPSPSPSPTPAPPSVRELVREGSDLAVAKEYAKAIPVLEKAEKLDPEDPEVHQWLFVAYSKTDPPRATRHAQALVRLRPGSLQARKAQEFLESVPDPADEEPLGEVPPQDLAGWEKLRWGMTEANLQAVYGPKLKRFRGRYLNPSHEVRWYMPRTIAGVRLHALLVMDADTQLLTAVYLRPATYPSGNDGDFEPLEVYLTERYGEPTREGLFLNWSFPSTLVRLRATHELAASVSLIYKSAK